MPRIPHPYWLTILIILGEEYQLWSLNTVTLMWISFLRCPINRTYNFYFALERFEITLVWHYPAFPYAYSENRYLCSEAVVPHTKSDFNFPQYPASTRRANSRDAFRELNNSNVTDNRKTESTWWCPMSNLTQYDTRLIQSHPILEYYLKFCTTAFTSMPSTLQCITAFC
jgi:hypothetical protein